MYERMLDQGHEPSLEEIRAHLGPEAFGRLEELERHLSARYQIVRALRFPFGNRYGWGWQYRHRSAHLLYAFFERGAFTVTIQVGDGQVPALEAGLDALSDRGRALWSERYPCGTRGGWVHVRVLDAGDLGDVLYFVHAKRKPKTTP